MARDRLTGLLYYDDFKEEAQRRIRGLKEPCILFSLNISNFKYINSVYGYEKGDMLLSTFADYFFHINEYCILASRVHSDRFAALIRISDDVIRETMTEHYDEIHKAFMQALEEEYPMAVLHINSGAYLVEDTSESISEIFDKAEMARKSIVNNYAETVCFYTEELEEKAQLERNIIPLFEHALKTDTIQIYLQPKINVDTQEMVGAEALARLLDHDGNLISPAVFIPILERFGLVTELDVYVARKVVELLNSWQEQGKKLFPISVNLSRVDFKKEYLLHQAIKDISKLNVPEKYVEFEVTETVFFEDISFISSRIAFLRDKGYKISMDDFGTGFSSLNSLGMLPVDIIKFDRGFVQNSLSSHKGLEIMTGLIDIFTKIDLDVICEGVETKEEEQKVRECGCKFVQGFLHDKPLPIEEFEKKYINQ